MGCQMVEYTVERIMRVQCMMSRKIYLRALPFVSS